MIPKIHWTKAPAIEYLRGNWTFMRATKEALKNLIVMLPIALLWALILLWLLGQDDD